MTEQANRSTEALSDSYCAADEQREIKRKTFIQKWRIRWNSIRYRIYPKRCRIRQYYNDNEVYVEFRTWGRWKRWQRPLGGLLTFNDVEMALRSIRSCPHGYWRVIIRLAHPAVNSRDQEYY